MKNKVTVIATITTPDGKEIFRSEHSREGATQTAEGKYHFHSIIDPMELILSDAQRHFIPAPTQAPGAAQPPADEADEDGHDPKWENSRD